MQSAGEPRRSLGLAATTSIVIGNMVGSGVFLLPASLAPYGVYSLWGWVVSTVGALLLARVFSRLSRRAPLAGGPYAYPLEVFGDFAGFLLAWMYWISIAAAVAAIAVALASYLGALVPSLRAHPLAGAGIALAATWLLTGVNILGVRAAGRLQLITVILKISPLLVFALWGVFYFNPHLLLSGEPVASAPVALDSSAALTMWAFLGLECATIPADHVRDPARTIPRATLYGTAIAAVFYILCTTAVMGIIPAASLEHSNAPFADAAKLLWGGWAGDLIALAAIISCFGALNGWILMSGQFPQAAARDKLFPKVFARELDRGTPALGLVFSSIVGTVLILMNFNHGLVETFNVIILIATFFTLVPYMLCSLAELLLGRGDKARGRNIALASLAFAFSLWATAGAGRDTLYWGTLLMLAGLPLYVWQKWSRTDGARA
ncbi:MAG TPA: amino acid permease [Steroidobacteraceae bacterium]|jgi:APA family basic amino acid/polyamine antiporter|nr:amino acid permease [Steroidobacteraceae bacterium]